jgi:hypothetical protein
MLKSITNYTAFSINTNWTLCQTSQSIFRSQETCHRIELLAVAGYTKPCAVPITVITYCLTYAFKA